MNDVAFRAEVAMAITRLTQVLAERQPTQQPLRLVTLADCASYVLWYEDVGVSGQARRWPTRVVTEQCDLDAVFVTGHLLNGYYEDDLSALAPAEAIRLGYALIAAGTAASVDNVTPLPASQETHP